MAVILTNRLAHQPTRAGLSQQVIISSSLSLQNEDQMSEDNGPSTGLLVNRIDAFECLSGGGDGLAIRGYGQLPQRDAGKRVAPDRALRYQ